MFIDPLSTSDYIRVTGKNEAFDGKGNRYRLERKYDCEMYPFLFGFVFFGILTALLMGCTLEPQPQYIEAEPASSALQRGF